MGERRWRWGRRAEDPADPPAPAVPVRGPAPASDAPRVTLYSRPGCHLCDDARAVIEAVCAATGEAYAEVCIDDDPELAQRFAHEIPVTFVDGRQHDFWRVDAARLRRALGA